MCDKNYENDMDSKLTYVWKFLKIIFFLKLLLIAFQINLLHTNIGILKKYEK